MSTEVYFYDHERGRIATANFSGMTDEEVACCAKGVAQFGLHRETEAQKSERATAELQFMAGLAIKGLR